MKSYRYRIEPFLEFCDENVTTLNQLTSRKIKEFEAEWRASGLQKQTINNQFGTLKQFLNHSHDIDAVSEDIVAALAKEDRVNTEKLVAERAQTIIEQMERFQSASREHVLFLLLWRTTVRIGTIYTLDLEDVYLNDEDRDRLRPPRERLLGGGRRRDP
ncbi:site-specific integrase [Natrinema altunense]|uniref:site-specific integrase n=1 Tax=Natrinema altunense TaxID=222984 RepID=UPI001A924340